VIVVQRKKRILVVTSDAGSARFFECARVGGPLVEDLSKPMHAEPPTPRSKPPRVHDRMGPGRHIIEARRTPRAAAEADFLKRVADRINAEIENFDALILCAPPRPLGALRAGLSDVAHERMSAEVAKDYLHETAADLSAKLQNAIA
jgi:protein required for attachment to host cells